jgi:hypothetical protein
MCVSVSQWLDPLLLLFKVILSANRTDQQHRYQGQEERNPFSYSLVTYLYLPQTSFSFGFAVFVFIVVGAPSGGLRIPKHRRPTYFRFSFNSFHDHP